MWINEVFFYLLAKHCREKKNQSKEKKYIQREKLAGRVDSCLLKRNKMNEKRETKKKMKE